jgi:phage shock protein A
MARRLALGLLLLPLILTAPAAGDDVYQRKQAVEDRIQALHDRIAGARAQEGVLTSKISALNGQIRTLEGQRSSATSRSTGRSSSG